MWSLIDSLTATRSIEIYDFQFFRFEFKPSLQYLFRFTFLTTLNIYKVYFKSHHIQIQRPRDLFSLCEATAFVRHSKTWQIWGFWTLSLLKWFIQHLIRIKIPFSWLKLIFWHVNWGQAKYGINNTPKKKKKSDRK